MLRTHRYAGFTAPVPQAAGIIDAQARATALRRVGLVLGFVILVALGSIWAVANVQYFDTQDAANPVATSHIQAATPLQDGSPPLSAKMR